MQRIAIFCGSKVGNGSQFKNAAEQLGSEIARRQIELVYGGGGIGLMGILANAALTNGGKVIGVIPEKLYEMEVAHMGLTELYRVKTMHERKALMADLSDGFIAMPGGIGTLEEITEVITWAQIGYHNKPCAFLNTDNFFKDFFTFFEHMEKQGFLYASIHEQVIVDSDPVSLLDKICDK